MNTDYLRTSKVVVYVIVQAHVLPILPYFAERHHKPCGPRTVFLSVAIAMREKVTQRCSPLRPCVCACMCTSVQQIAFGSRHQKNVQDGAAAPTREDSTARVCLFVCARSCLKAISADTCTKNVTEEFLTQPLMLGVPGSLHVCHY